jgi:hypothetical protein
LVGSDTIAGDWFGGAVAISGPTVVVGAPNHDSDAGAAYIFTQSGTSWTQSTEFAGTVAAGSFVGYSVAVSGSSAVVGAPGSGNDGAAYVLVQSNDQWALESELPAPKGDSDENFGNSVSVDGSTVAVGAWQNRTGAVYVFTQDGASWSPAATLQGLDPQGGSDLGASVVVSGQEIAVGGVEAQGNSGAVYLFDDSSGSWLPTSVVTPTSGDDGDFLSSRSLAVSGNEVLVGAPGHSGGLNGGNPGQALIFVDSGTRWTESAKLIPTESLAGFKFGSAVGVSGLVAVIGAPGAFADTGRAYVTTPDIAGLYTPTLAIEGKGTVAGDRFGAAAALSGTTAIIGAPGRKGRGAAYVFEETTNVPYSGGTVRCKPGQLVDGQFSAGECRGWTQTAELTGNNTTTGDNFAATVAINGNTAIIGAPNHNNTGAAYIYTYTNNQWTQTAELTGNNTTTGDNFAATVAINGNTAIIGAPNHNNTGAAYIYTYTNNQWTQTAELTGNNTTTGDNFAAAIGLSDSMIVVGSPGTNSAAQPDVGGGFAWPA